MVLGELVILNTFSNIVYFIFGGWMDGWSWSFGVWGTDENFRLCLSEKFIGFGVLECLEYMGLLVLVLTLALVIAII